MKLLPVDLAATEEAQEERMRELKKELEGLEGERVKALEDRERLLERVDGVIGGFKRVV